MTPNPRPRDPSFAVAAAPAQLAPHLWEYIASEHWMQGRTQFGGLVAAAMTHAMAATCDMDQRLRTLSIVFAAPIDPGVAQIETTLDRTGKSTVFSSAVLVQNGSLRTRAHAVFAHGRESSISLKAPLPILEFALADAEKFPYIEGVVPTFLQNFDLRLGVGAFPYSGSNDGIIGGYARHNPPIAGTSALLGLLDAWPPAILPMAAGPAAGSTVSWTAHFLREPPTDPDAWYTFRYDTVASEDGYATYVGTLACNGDVIAWSEQLSAVFT